MADVITVSQLNRYVKSMLDREDALFDLALQGEIYNFVRNSRSGHCYFSLRDAECSVKAVMFRSEASRLAFRPEEGMWVVVRCRATLYERDGAFQVYVNAMFPDGIGAAQLALEQLKRKLEQEGLFDLDRKKPLPAYPRCIGLVTSKTGAALQDIRNVVSRRWPAAKLLLCPVSVQGFEAAQQVAQAIQTLDQSGRADVIIVARGGGSREDLWVFNAECIARAAFQCHTPLISAIGHEIDVTILDFVADCRAPTPSAAAELAVPDRVQLSLRLQGYAQTLRQQMEACKADCADRLEDAAEMLAAYGPGQRLAQSKEKLQEISKAVAAAARQHLEKSQASLGHAAALAGSLDPYQVLARGYAMVERPAGKICAVSQLAPGDAILLRGAGHTARCTVTAVEEQDESTQKF